MKPLGTEFIPDFFKAMKAFSGAKEGMNTEDLLKNINSEGLEAIQKLIDVTLQKSFPEESEEERHIFGMKYMGILIAKIFEINSAKEEQGELLERIKQHARKPN